MDSSSDNSQTFWDHLEVLRWTLARCAVALAVAACAAFAFVPWLFDHIVMAPSRGDFFLYRWLADLGSLSAVMPEDLSKPFHVSVININLASQFFLHISLSCWLGLLLSLPYMLYELWRFIVPALYEGERRQTRFAFLFGTLMFYAGCCVGYGLVFPLTLRFLYTYQLSASIANELSLTSYMDNFFTLVLAMGLVFELPMVSMLLSKVGVLRRSFFSRYRRHAIVALMVLAAFITPSSDPFTMMAVFLPIYMLWEMSALLVRK